MCCSLGAMAGAVALREAMPPNRPFAGLPWRGLYVIEMPAGVIAATSSGVGDQLDVTPPLVSFEF